jgi:hypothetical protein
VVGEGGDASLEAADEAPRTSCRKGQTLDRLMADTLAGRSRVTVLRGEPGWHRAPGVLAICPMVR